MPSTTGGADTICPFFLRDYTHTITCEGAVDGEETVHRFATVKDKVAHQERYCFKREYGECPYVAPLEIKYNNKT